MQTVLTPVGDDLALVLDSSILNALNIDATTPLEVVVDNGALTIRPAVSPKLRAALAEVNRLHAQTLKDLSR